VEVGMLGMEVLCHGGMGSNRDGGLTGGGRGLSVMGGWWRGG
jgi:hypothetical protein